MKQWAQVKLKDIATKIGSGATPAGGEKAYKTEGISLIRSLNVYDFGFEREGLAFIDEQQAAQLDNVQVASRDILLNITGASVARCCMVPDSLLPARVNQHVALVRIDPAKADPYYVLSCINSPRYKAELMSIAQGGATREALTKSKIETFEIPLPPLLTQRKIAVVLSAYDDLIENNTRRIAILEEMAQAIYREWFVNFRFPGHEKVKLTNSPLGKIPEGWKVARLETICERITSGGTPRTSTDEYWGGDIPWLSSGETGNTFIIETDKTITQEGVSNSSTRFARSGCTVIASAGQGKTRGQTSMLRLDCYINQSTIALTADGKKATDNFLFFDLMRRYNQFRQISDGSSRGSLTTKLLADLEVIVPPADLVQQFDALVAPAVKNIEVILRKNKNLRTTRDLLLPKLISGQLDVEELDIETGEPLVEAEA